MKISICAALYESGRPFLAAFVEALRVAVQGHDVTFVAAVDGLLDPETALADLAEDIEVVITEAPGGHTLAGVRGVMLTAGQATGADILIFVDMDDLIAPDCLQKHLDALEEADFSYGDLELIDAAGRSLGRRFFDNAGVPSQVEDVAAICDRNFLGFSNSAVRTSEISPVALVVPEDIVAADWWFFTMLLLGGLRGRRTVGAVASYRLHDSNILGAGSPTTVSEAVGQAEVMLRHYRAFSAHPLLAARADGIEEVLRWLRCEPAADVKAHLQSCCEKTGAWFDGIGHLAARLSAVPATDNAVFQ